MKTPALTLISLLLLSACAHTHPGQLGTSVKGPPQPLKISAQRQSGFSDDHYTFVTFTIENKSEDMLRIKSSDLDFAGPMKDQASVLVGKDLVAWGDAHDEEFKKSQHNKKIAQLAMVLGGLALGFGGAATHNNAAEISGFGVAAAGEGWTVGDKIDQLIEKTHNPKPVPDTHIYSQFSVPIAKYVRKWAVIQHPKDAKIQNLLITVTLEDNSEATYEIALK